MCAYRQTVGLLGGSFDPVHNGHLSIARSFVESEYISELWLLLTPESPHKKGKQEFTNYGLRLKMLSLTFRNCDNMLPSDIEKQLSPPYYSVHTMRHIVEKYPDKEFFLCMGEDSLENFHTWHQWEEILEYCDLLVARRTSFQPLRLDPVIQKKTHYVNHDPVDISSTEIRDKVRGKADISDLVPPPVADIIKQFRLYRK